MSFAVGSLVKARGREWVVLPESTADTVVARPLGGGDDEVAGFYLPVEAVEPAAFRLPDPAKAGDYRSCRLLRDALRLGFRSSAGPFRSFARIAVEPRPYQLVPLLLALKLDPVRLLIADDVGVGKTVEAGLIARELIDRGEVRRFAVLCPPQIAEQWQAELSAKFHLEAELVLPGTVPRLEKACRMGQSVFDRFPFVIVSTDFIKADRRRDDFVRECPELVIVDEAHTCARAGDGRGARHQRHQLVRQLATDKDRHVLLVAEQFSQLKKEDTKDHAGGATAGADSLGEEMATLRAVGRAVAEAGKEVGELHEATAALGMGPGSPGSNDPRAVAELFKRVRSDPTLRRICELAGRFRRVAQSKQRMKATHGLDDVVGVEPGGDVGRLLPAELAKLMIPELELDTLRRIAEREAICREHHAVEPVGKGPVIIALDESGSMDGAKIHTAKALALALAWVARQQRRWCALVAYSGDSGERLLPLPPGRWDESRLADWLSAFIGHGSDIDVPVREMPRMYRELKAPTGVTDLVFVTDARCRLPAGVRDTFLAWKQVAQARLVTLVIDNQPGDLAHVSDEVHPVRSLTPDSDAVGRVLSL